MTRAESRPDGESADLRLVCPFPDPPPAVAAELDALREAWDFTAGGLRPPVPSADLQRPWDPASCPPKLRGQMWAWLDDVVAWLNREHGWHPEDAVPGCWPEHPHLIHELALLACLRHYAGLALTPEPLSDWHRSHLPGFHDRLREHLNGAPCPPGGHKTWPAATRDIAYREGTANRVACYHGDVCTTDCATWTEEPAP